MTLRACEDVEPARWLTQDASPWHRTVSLGPAGFPAYARLRFLPDPQRPGQSEADAVPREGLGSETEQLRAALETLADRTTTPDRCFFALWDGWGSDLEGDPPRFAPAFPRAVLYGPKVVLPHRSYLLFEGPLTDFGRWGAADLAPGLPREHFPDPAFTWPTDRAWCVTRDVDPHYAGIAADAHAVLQLCQDPRIDVVVADPAQPQPAYR